MGRFLASLEISNGSASWRSSEKSPDIVTNAGGRGSVGGKPGVGVKYLWGMSS